MAKRKTQVSAVHRRKVSSPDFPTYNDPIPQTPLSTAYRDFIISRQALRVSATTMRYYNTTLKRFVLWLQREKVTQPDEDTPPIEPIYSPEEIRSVHVNAFLALFNEKGISKSYAHTYARTIRTFVNYLFEEDILRKKIKVPMPEIKEDEQMLKVLDENQVDAVLSQLDDPRDLAMFAFFIDTGVRREELANVTWGDVFMDQGLVLVRKGKGGTQRPVSIRAKALKHLIRYRRTLKHTGPNDALFQTDEGTPLSNLGIRSALVRIKEKTGVDLSSHALRRTFATLAIRSKMNPLNISRQMGHTTLKMTDRYARLIKEDLLEDHQEHSPFDKFGK